MWELDCEESWVPKNWCFWTLVLEKTLESPLDCKEVQPVHPKGDKFWVFFGRTDAEAETPIIWPPHARSWLIGKDSDAGRDWGQEEKGMTEDKMSGWHHQLDGHEFEWTPGDGDGQGGLVCCKSWGRKESDTTEWLNWTEGSSVSCYEILTVSLPLYLVFARQSGIHCILCTFSLYVCMCVLSCFSRVWLFVTLWTVTHQAPLSVGFSMTKQLKWTELRVLTKSYLLLFMWPHWYP